FDTKTLQITSRIAIDHAWLGLAWHPDGTRLFSAGASENTIYELTWKGGRLSEPKKIAINSPEKRSSAGVENAGFVGGLAIEPDGRRLYAVHVFGQAVSVVDIVARREIKRVALPAEPYFCLLTPDGRTLFVSLWGGAKVLILDAETLTTHGEV